MTRKAHENHGSCNQQAYHTHHNIAHGHSNGISSQTSIAEDVAYANPGSASSYDYPKEVEIEDYRDNARSQQSMSSQGYELVARSWTHVNPNAHQMTNPALDPNYAPYDPPSYHNDSQRTTAMYAAKRRPTEKKLEILNSVSPQMGNSIRRYEQQGQRAGPWDSIGYIRDERTGKRKDKSTRKA